MPTSIVVHLEHSFKLTKKSLGRLLQGWFLRNLQSKHPDLSAKFHEGHQIRPYTVSTIFPVTGSKDDQQHSAFRLTFLDDDLGNLFIEDILPDVGETIQLLWMTFKIEGYDLNHRANRWAGYDSYADMSRRFAYGKEKKCRFHFYSPTTFRNNGVDIPLPDPRSVFRSYEKTWNAFVPEALRIDAKWISFADQAIVINRIYDLKTERWLFAGGERGAVTGYIGNVDFSLLPKSKLDSEWEDFYLVGAAIFRTLSAFSFYSGTGYHPTIGLGQTFPRLQE
jgi:CRISPR/Cas system endoribonuclease Cas6 (RAMP superfamily)